VGVETRLATKIAAFCRELTEPTLADLARERDAQEVYRRAQEALRTGDLGSGFESDLDTLDALVFAATGQSLFGPVIRTYAPLASTAGGEAGAQWWTCPRALCSGRGRVRSGQSPHSCGATGQQLVAGPFPR